MNNFNILIKFPTRNRPKRFFETLDLYISKANNINNIFFLITCDVDDLTMNNFDIQNRLNEYQAKYNLQYFFENNTSKIEAVNANIDKVLEWDILLLASDDMIPIVEGYDDIIRQDMRTYHPNLDGILWYNDGHQNNTNTLSILGKKYYDRFSYVYHPSYKSLYCDNEYTEVATFLGKYYKTDQVIIKHIHPVYNEQNYDGLYIKNESYMNIDKLNYETRKNNNFDLDNLLPILSILTPSIPSRISNSLSKLINKVEEQIQKRDLEKKVEHLVLIDNKIQTVGRKRNTLVQAALGRFIAFVDDDDDISDNYVIELVNAINANPNVDVITFKQDCYVNDNPKSTVIFGLTNKQQPYIPGTIFTRKPYHVCAWNRKIAQQYKVPCNNICEDGNWVSQLWSVAKTEYFIDKVLHTYTHNETNTSCPQTGENSVYNNTQL